MTHVRPSFTRVDVVMGPYATKEGFLSSVWGVISRIGAQLERLLEA
jgi:hypothetical protein